MEKRHNILFLFDVDGTLIKSDGAGSGAVKRAFEEYFGKVPDTSGYIFDGKTDPLIFSQLAELAEIPEAVFSENRYHFENLVYDHMSITVKEKDIRVINRIEAILILLKNYPNVYTGLVTGNDIRGAYYKLNAVDLKKWFRVGAYGSDHMDRNELPPIAVKRAERLYDVTFKPENIWIIGDTPNDVIAGRKNRYSTLAVATGRYSIAQLDEHGPDIVVDKLTPEIFVEIIEG